jgi:hypothetical protein
MLRLSFAVGATVVMNDLTNTLRHGDITVFRPDLWPNGGSKFMLVEAKSGRGGNKARARRQVDSMSRIMDYISTDTREAADGVWQRIAAKDEPKHHFETITRLAKSLPSAGWATEEIEPGLYYSLIDCAFEGGDLSETFASIPVHQREFLAFYVNELKDETWGYYPFLLCFRDPEVAYRFYNGEFIINVFLDLAYVREALARRGLSIIPSNKDMCLWQVVPTTPQTDWGEGEMHIGAYPIGRLGGEFISLDWLMNNIVLGPLHDYMRSLQEVSAQDHPRST